MHFQFNYNNMISMYQPIFVPNSNMKLTLQVIIIHTRFKYNLLYPVRVHVILLVTCNSCIHTTIASNDILFLSSTIRYTLRLAPAKKTGTRKGIYSGAGSGVMWLLIYATYALGFWYGVGLILDSRHEENPIYTPAVLLIVSSLRNNVHINKWPMF